MLGLVAAATIAIIVSATRSAMASNRGIIEVLHFVGANERFISREFERHFLGLGVRAGLAGAVAAIVAFLLLPFLMHLLGGGIVTAAETRRLIGTGELDFGGYLLCVLVVDRGGRPVHANLPSWREPRPQIPGINGVIAGRSRGQADYMEAGFCLFLRPAWPVWE